MPKVRKVCPGCGSANIVKDAWASWDDEKQEWELDNVFDEIWCHACEQNSSYAEDQPIEDQGEASDEDDGNPFHPESPEGRAWRDGDRSAIGDTGDQKEPTR